MIHIKPISDKTKEAKVQNQKMRNQARSSPKQSQKSQGAQGNTHSSRPTWHKRHKVSLAKTEGNTPTEIHWVGSLRRYR